MRRSLFVTSSARPGSPRRARIVRLAAAAACLVLAAPAVAAPPALPAEMPYQGLLLDGTGQPRSGPVDLTLRIYDAPTGGTLLYTQSWSGVVLADGVFTVDLGPTGAATDSPDDPLVTSLADALAGDLAATGPSRFVELTVGTEGALPRTQLLAVPYALRAGSAASADSADVAVTATNVTSVDGVDAAFVSQIFQHVAFDGGDPPNDDPREGFADVDGDGRANFVDSDNDGDGIDDSAELLAGSDINLVTPTIAGFEPPAFLAGAPVAVEVQGTSFSAGIVATFGASAAGVSGVTSTSLVAAVPPQPVGTAPVVLTLPNGESAQGSYDFHLPFGADYGPPIGASEKLELDVSPSGFLVGGDTVRVDPDFDGITTLTALAGSAQRVAKRWAPTGEASALTCSLVDPQTCDVRFYRDQDGDDLLTAAESVVVETIVNASGPGVFVRSPSIRYDAAGRAVLGYNRKAGTSEEAVLAYDRDGDGGFGGPAERVTLEPLAVSSLQTAGEVAVDAAGRAAFLYPDGADVRLAFDRNGDGDFADTVAGQPEIATLVTPSGLACLGLAFDAAGRLAAVVGGSAGATLYHDRDGDDAFGGAGETLGLTALPVTGCGLAAHSGGGVAVAHDADGPVLLVDRDDDGAFDLGTETHTLDPGAGNVGALAVDAAADFDGSFVATASLLYAVIP